MKKILIVGPAWVGDMIMAQSLFKALKQNDAECVIDVLAPDWSSALLDRMPEVRNKHLLPIGHGAFQFKCRIEIAKQLRKEYYDEAIVLPNSWKSALIPWLAKIPKRIGWLGEMRWGLLNDARKLDKKAIPRMVDRFILLAYPKGTTLSNLAMADLSPRLQINPNTVIRTLSKFNLSVESSSQPILALCPGAEFGSSKRWPEYYYAALASEKIKEGWIIWLLGSPKEKTITQKIIAALPPTFAKHCVDLTGKTKLDEVIDLLSVVTAVVSNDSGLMHIAAAANKPLIALYGSTDPSFTPPLNKIAKIARVESLPCSPCFKRECPLKHHACMQNLVPEKILNMLKSLELQCKS